MTFASSVAELEQWLSRPDSRTVESLSRLSGDLMILGAAGKMGPTLAKMARRALAPERQVIAVSRYSKGATKADLEAHGVRCIACDLLDPNQVNALPEVPNLIFMAGQKFGTQDAPELTWMINAIVPSLVARKFHASRIVAFSTGCVYPLVSVASAGSVETDALAPPGEYAYSCVARERVFQYYSKSLGTKVLIFRLNYAIDSRYGVLHDIATKVWQGKPIDLSAGFVNVIWQGDANARALQCLELVDHPPAILNITGDTVLSVESIARKFGELLNKPVRFEGTPGPVAWLSNAARSFELFGPCSVSLDAMLEQQAHWIRSGGESLGKPTHFEATDGRF